MQKSKLPAVIIAAVLVALVFAAFLLLILNAVRSSKGYELSLEVWGAVDDSSVFRDINTPYAQTHPFIRRVEYRKMLVDEYKDDLIDALASGTGPDVFFIRNTWIPEFQDKILPAPESLVNQAAVQNAFVDTVADDVIVDGEVYGLPLSVDSLALYYNKDLFNLEGITRPPSTWDEFLAATRRLTVTDESGTIAQSGAALGTARNINRSTDIVNALLLQSGTGLEFTSREDRGRVQLGSEGKEALEFYTQFSDIDSPYYAWNFRQDYSIDAFQEGNLAMMLNYSWHYDTIKRKNSRLNFGVAPLPQFSDETSRNYPNYWVLVAAKNGGSGGETDSAEARQARTFESWQYVRYLALHQGGEYLLTNARTGNQQAFVFALDPAKQYAEETGAPAARRDILETQKSDPVVGPFATGNLIARSWRQADAGAIETAMASIIDSLAAGAITSDEAVRQFEERIRTYSRR